MIKKVYMKPTVIVIPLQRQCHILAGSLQKSKTSLPGWDDTDGYDENGGNQKNAW